MWKRQSGSPTDFNSNWVADASNDSVADPDADASTDVDASIDSVADMEHQGRWRKMIAGLIVELIKFV